VATVQGTRYTYTDTANNEIDMSETLAMISPSDVPLLSIIGKDGLEATAPKHEWLEDILRPLDTTVADSTLNNTTDPVTFNVAAGTGVYIVAGDILKVEAELLRVTVVATDAITVARGFGGSTNAAHASGSAVRLLQNVMVQDAAVTTPRTTTKSGLFNYTQIFQDAFTITSTQKATDKYTGPNDETADQLDRLTKIAWILWERSLLDGRKVAPAAGVAGSMDGILVRLTTNAYAKAGAYLVEDFILQMMQDAWAAGGGIDTIALGAFQKRQANKFLDSMRMTTRTDRIAGSVVDTYTSDFGTADIVLDRNMPADTVLGLTKAKITFGPMRAHSLKATKLPQTTVLAETWQVVGQYTSETKNENAHGKITGLATS
jgi:hypothetical protein